MKRHEPVKKYIGKLGILCLNSVENTIVITIIINKGFVNCHKDLKQTCGIAPLYHESPALAVNFGI